MNARVKANDVIGLPEDAFPVIARVADEARAALCAEAVGCFAQMQAITLDYLRTRRQFGTAIGSFQVLQHRAVDMLVELEQSHSMAMYAILRPARTPQSNASGRYPRRRLRSGSRQRPLGSSRSSCMEEQV